MSVTSFEYYLQKKIQTHFRKLSRCRTKSSYKVIFILTSEENIVTIEVEYYDRHLWLSLMSEHKIILHEQQAYESKITLPRMHFSHIGKRYFCFTLIGNAMINYLHECIQHSMVD